MSGAMIHNESGQIMTTTLHYIFDPLCGWCYAAAPLAEAAGRVPGLTLALHGGGMLIDDNRRPITPQWRAYVVPHDRRIAQLTGQPFGEAYFEGLLRDADAVMDSEPPTTAILAAEALGGRGLDLLHRLQRAHYVEGRRIAEPAVLAAAAAELGLVPAAFRAACAELAGGPTRQHIAASRRLLDRAGTPGFPTFALEYPDGRLVALDIARWLGRADAWQAYLAGLLQAAAPAAATGGPSCSPDGCAV